MRNSNMIFIFTLRRSVSLARGSVKTSYFFGLVYFVAFYGRVDLSHGWPVPLLPGPAGGHHRPQGDVEPLGRGQERSLNQRRRLIAFSS